MAHEMNTPVRTHSPDTAVNTSGEQLVISHATELMRTYKAGKAFSAGQRIAAAYDCDNNPMIFSIGDDQHLHLVMRKGGSASGWEQLDLSAELGVDRAVQTFAVSQEGNGTLRLAMALERPNTGGMSELYISRPLSNDPQVTDWHFFGRKWIPRPFTEQGLQITRILLGTNDDREGTPLMLVGATPEKGDAGYWFVNTDPDAPQGHWSHYPLPTNAQSVLDLAVGTHPLGRGVYALYLNNGERVLQFRQLEDAINVNLDPPKQARRLTILPNEQGIAELYVAGDGVHLFKADNQMSGARAAPVQTSDPLPEIADLVVRADAGTVALWALTTQHELLYTTSSRQDSVWSTPVRLRKDVAQLAPLRNPRNRANELLMVGANDVTLAYLWQVPETGLWQETDITLPDGQKTLPFHAYLTQVHCKTDKERPVVDAEVTVTASAWCHVTINGIYYVLDANQPIKVRTDTTGGLAITNKVTDMSTPTFKLQLGGTCIDLDPARKITEGLRKIQTGDDWLAQKTQSGLPLLKNAYDAQRRQAAAEAIQRLSQASETFTDSSGGKKADAARANRFSVQAAGVTQLHHSPGTAPRAETVAPHEPRSHGPIASTWGISFEEAQPRVVHSVLPLQDPHLMNAPMSAGSLALQAPPTQLLAGAGLALPSFGDLWEQIEQGFEKVKRFFVEVGEQLVNFVIDLGNRVVTLAITAAQEVYRAMSWLLEELLDIDLDELVKWLGFLFNWNDIRNTHTFMRATAELGYHQFLGGLGKLKEFTGEAFTKLREHVLGKELPSSRANDIFKKRINDSQQMGDSNHLSLPQVSWIGNALSQNLQNSTLAPVSLAVELAGTFTRLLDTQGELFQNTFKQVTDEIIARLDTLSLGEILHKLWVVVTESVINTTENIVLGLVELAEVLAKAVWKFFNTRWDVPLLTSLYEEHIAPGSELTPLDLGCLAAAIPTTIIFKLTTGEAPVSAAQAEALKRTPIKTVEELLAPWLAPQPRTRASRMQVNRLLEQAEVPLAATYKPTNKEVAMAWVGSITGLAGGALRFLSGLVNAGQELMSAPGGGDTPVPVSVYANPKFQLQAFKLGCDLIGYAGSFVNMTVYLALTEIQGGLKTARVVLDSIVLYGQGLLRLKDGFLLVWWMSTRSEFNSVGREVLSWLETAFGALMLVLSAVAIALEANEPIPKVLEGKTDVWRALLGLKGTQNILNGIYQILSGPRATLQRLKENPKLAVAFWGVFGTRVVLSSLAIPGITLLRAGLDYSNRNSSVIFAGGS